MSFMRMNIAARFTGSSSDSAAVKSRSYSGSEKRLELRPIHLFAFEAISDVAKMFMKYAGSGWPMVQLYIWRSARNLLEVSGLPGSDEKYTDADTVLSSRSIPALRHACLTIAWVFCRGALIEVTNTNLSLRPSRARMPSAPGFQPAPSRMRLAFSTLNSHFGFGERKRSGRFRKF